MFFHVSFGISFIAASKSIIAEFDIFVQEWQKQSPQGALVQGKDPKITQMTTYVQELGNSGKENSPLRKKQN